MSKFEQKKIDDASPQELRDFASSFLGIDTEGLTDDKVMAKLKAAHESQLIYVRLVAELPSQTGAPPPNVSGEDRTGRGLVGSLGHDDPKVRLVLHAEEREGVVNTRHKEVGVNGVVWLIKRGVPVDVPYRVYEALNNAIRTNVTHDSEGTVIEQNVHNTPFNVESMPPPEEVLAWKARTGGLEMA